MNTLPVSCRHCVQWQIPTRTGSPLTRYRTAPHVQPPCRSRIAISSYRKGESRQGGPVPLVPIRAGRAQDAPVATVVDQVGGLESAVQAKGRTKAIVGALDQSSFV